MSAVEKLFVQIFEKKKAIIEQVKRQAELFDQRFASKLLIDEIAPPPWLWNPSLHAHTSEFKEELISGLLFPLQQPAIPYSNSFCSLYSRPVAIPENGVVPSTSFAEGCASKKDIESQDRQPVSPKSPINDYACASSGGPELEASVTSPKDQRDVRTSGIYQEGPQSLVKIQRSKSRQRALEIRTSTKRATSRLCMGSDPDAHTTGSGIASLRPDHTNEMESAKPVDIGCAMDEVELGDELGLVKSVQINDQSPAISEVRVGNELESVKPVDNNNESSVVEEVIVCDSHSKVMDSNISSRITRSRNSQQQFSSMNESQKQGGSSYKDKEIGGTEEEAIPAHQSDGLLESINLSEVAKQVSKARKVKKGLHGSKKKQSNDYHGRMTRLRSSSRQFDCVNEPSFLGGSCDTAKDDGSMLGKSTGKLAEPSLLLSGIEGDTAMQNVQDSQVPPGRILIGKKDTRIQESKENFPDSISRNARWQDSFNSEGVPKAVNSNVSDQRVRQSRFGTYEKIKTPAVTQTSEERSLVNNEDLELSAVNAEQLDGHAGGDGMIGTGAGTKRITKPLNSNTLDYSAPLSTSTLNVPLLEEPIPKSDGLDLPIDSGFQSSILPCAKTSDIVGMERYSAMAPETEHPTNAPTPALVCSGSTLGYVDDIVGLQVLVSRSPSDNIFVKPKVLNFDKLEDCSLNEISCSALENKLRGGSSVDLPLDLSGPADLLNKVMPINDQAKHNSCQVRPLLENHVYLSHEGEACSGLSEGQEKETAEASITSDSISLSSEKETPEVYKNEKSDTLLENDKLIERECLTALEVASENSYRDLLKHLDFNLSNENTGIKMNSSSENNEEELDAAKFTKSVSDDGERDADTSDDLKLPTDVFVQVDETNVNSMQQNLSLDICQYQTVGSYLTGSCISDDTNVGTSQSSERQTAKKHIQQEGIYVGTSQSSERQTAKKHVQQGVLSSGKEGSWPQHKRRKIEGQLKISQSASPCLRVMPPQSIHENHIVNNFNSVEDDLKDLKFQQVPISCEKDVGQPSVSISLVGEADQHLLHRMKEVCEPSPKLHVEQGEVSLGEKDSDSNISTSVHDLLLLPAWSKLGTSNCPSADNVGVVNHTTSVFDTTEQCSLEDNPDSLCYNSIFEPKNAENSTCTDIVTEQRKSHLGGNFMFSGYSDGPSHDQSTDLIDTDPTMPVLEGFVMPVDSGRSCVSGDAIQLEKMDLPDIDLERASLLEQLCRSASMSTPLCQFPTTYKLQGTPNLNQSVPNGYLESMDMQSNFSIYDNDNTSVLSEAGYRTLEDGGQRSYSDCEPFAAYSAWDVKKPFASPVGKHWDRIASYSSSSERKRSLNPDLPCINEENEDTEEVADKFEDVNSDMMPVSAKREPLADITEDPNLAASVSEAEVFARRGSMDSISSQINFTGTHKGKQKSCKRRYTNKAKESHRISQLESGVKTIRESLRSRFSKPKLSGKPSTGKGTKLSGTDCKRNNIVSNMTSFIPLVQQNQAAAICTGKRDVKVRALEAAEAAKRLAEKKENERKMKKEALKIERARLEQENIKQIEIEKKRKEEERKQKEANLAAKKRQKEEEERKEKERKRKRVEEAWKQQRGPEKLLHGKEVKKTKCQAPDERARDGKKTKDKLGGSHGNMEERGNNNLERLSKDEARTMASSTDAIKTHILHEDYANSSVCGDNTKVTRTSPNRTGSNMVTRPSPEQSYDMSPYKCSDDEEDEEEDDRPNNKFIPSWASKKLLELAVSSQQRVDPKLIFPPDTFCIAEVVMPRLK